MAGTRFDCKEHSLFDGSGTAAGGAGGGPGVRGRRAVSVAPPRHSRLLAGVGIGFDAVVDAGVVNKVVHTHYLIYKLTHRQRSDPHRCALNSTNLANKLDRLGYSR